MASSLKIILHGKVYNDGTQAVMLQCKTVSGSGTIWKRRTLCKVKANQFDKASGRIIKHPNMLVFNMKISQAFSQAEKRLHLAELDNRPITPDQIIAPDVVVRAPTGNLVANMQTYIRRCQQKDLIHTADKYGSHLKRLSDYLGKDKSGTQLDIHMDDVDEDWVLAWVVWLKENGSKSPNTIHRRMAFLNTLYQDARKRGLTKADPLAFLEFKKQPTRKPKLTMEEIQRLEALQLEGREQDACNTFLLQFYTYGSRISDALNWKKSDVRQEGDTWYLSYISIKTKDFIDVRLNEKAKQLVSRYMTSTPGRFLLPWLAKYQDKSGLSDQANKHRFIKQIGSKTEMVNNTLKTVAQKAAIALNLTTHIARHTFATLADSRITDKRKISAALGHSRFATTEVYLSELRQSDVNDAMEAVWR